MAVKEIDLIQYEISKSELKLEQHRRTLIRLCWNPNFFSDYAIDVTRKQMKELKEEIYSLYQKKASLR